MDDRIHLQIVTPSAIIVDEMAGYVRLPLEGGSIGVLHGHAPLIGALTAGVVKYNCGGKDCYAAVDGGVVKVASDEIALLVRSASCVATLDAAREMVRQMRKTKESCV